MEYLVRRDQYKILQKLIFITKNIKIKQKFM